MSTHLRNISYAFPYYNKKNMNVIERIKQLKNDRGWTDYRLAMEAMIPQSTLASIYERNTPPKLDILDCLCHAFGITLAQFFQEDEAT